jgi:ribosomal RNA-processing protein 8
MALFDVPGWTMSSEPVKEAASTSKKRKRPVDHDDEKFASAQVNLDKLMETLKGGEDSHGKPKRKRQKGKKLEKGTEDEKTDRKKDSSPERKKGEKDRAAPSQKKPKEKKQKAADTHLIVTRADPESTPAPGGLTIFQNRMKQSLDGARFRYVFIAHLLLNE